jgi:hypothetical protein
MTCQPTGGATAKYQTTTMYNRFRCLCAVSPFFRCLRLVAAAAIPLRFRCLLIAQQLRCNCADAKAALVLPIDGTTGPGGGGGGGGSYSPPRPSLRALRGKVWNIARTLMPFPFFRPLKLYQHSVINLLWIPKILWK